MTSGASGRKKRKGSTPSGDKVETESQKGDVPPTPEVAESKAEGEENEEGEDEADKAPRTVRIASREERADNLAILMY